MLFGIQPIHILIIIIVAVLIFGANKLPEMGRSLGRTISEFKQGTKEAAEGFKEEVNRNGPVSNASALPPQVVSPAPENSFSMAGNFCIQCGAPNLPEAHFCASCGTKLPEKTA
jgi:sec-independent protein translocase protein TatA